MKAVPIAIYLLVGSVAAPCSELRRDEAVILFPTIAYQVKNGWTLEFHGWIYEPEKRRLSTAVLRRVLGMDGEELTTAEKKTFLERTQFFLADNERRKTVSIRIGGKTKRMAASAANGHFKSRVDLSDDEFRSYRDSATTNGLLAFQTVSEDGRIRPVAGVLHLVEESGLSVISDIDDTIKVSQVLDRHALVQNTFCKPFQAVPGMAAAYQSWSNSANVRFHYVSASPWQLYAPLSEFVRSEGFPPGTFHLKDFRFKDQTFFDLFRSPESYKRRVIEPILKRFPKRRFVLIGDSGEKDPEIYGALARSYPRQITRILIRDVTGETADSERYRQAFKHLPPGLGRIFKNPEEIQQAIP